MCGSDCGVKIEGIADGEEGRNARGSIDGRGIYEHNGVKDRPRRRWVYMRPRRRETVNQKACQT